MTEEETFRRLKKRSFQETISMINSFEISCKLLVPWSEETKQFVYDLGWSEIEIKEYDLEHIRPLGSLVRDDLIRHIAELKSKNG